MNKNPRKKSEQGFMGLNDFLELSEEWQKSTNHGSDIRRISGSGFLHKFAFLKYYYGPTGSNIKLFQTTC